MAEHETNAREASTFEGARRLQIRHMLQRSPRERLEAMIELEQTAKHLAAAPRVSGTASNAPQEVQEPQPAYDAPPPAGKHRVTLSGCTPIPLAGYLKALGILRLVAEQADPEARGAWQNEHFVLESRLDETSLRRFFLEDYQPTPIISPWNGRAGFLEGEDNEDSQRKGAVILREVEQSAGRRLEKYRSVINQIKGVPAIAQLNAVRSEVKELESLKKKKQAHDAERLSAAKKEEKSLKSELLTALRAELDDDFLQWLDACLALTEDEAYTAPLLGSGGNEGSMDYSINHLITLSRLIDPESDEATDAGRCAIDDALFQKAAMVDTHGNPGFLSPYGVGGANMGSGFSASVTENAWNTVLMLEGALLFAATATRRLESQGAPGLSFPFVVQAVQAGHGGVAAGESSRPELWTPLWKEPLSLTEMDALLSEGRATLGRRQARNGLDMARAIASLGVDRGLYAFQRYGFFERRGQGYYVAAPLERFSVRRNPAADLIVDLENNHWLDRFRSLARRKNAPARIQSLVRRMEDYLFELTTSTHPSLAVQRLLKLLGEVQLYLARSPKARDPKEGKCPPVPSLSAEWLARADDGSVELALAAALAGLHGRNGRGDYRMPMRAHLAPERPGLHPTWAADDTRAVTWAAGAPLPDNLATTLHRRLLQANQGELPDKPLHPSRTAPLGDVAAWLAGDLDEQRLAELLPGLMLVRIPRGAHPAQREASLPAAYRLLKPLFCTDEQLHRAGVLPPERSLPLKADLLRRLEANDVAGALELGRRRRRAAGIGTGFRQVAPGIADGRRLLAALMVPISDAALKSLLSARQAETESSDTTENA